MELTVTAHPTTPIPSWIGLFLLLAGVGLAWLNQWVLNGGLGRSRHPLERRGLGVMFRLASCGGSAWLVIAVLTLLIVGAVIVSGHAELIPAPVSPRTFP